MTTNRLQHQSQQQQQLSGVNPAAAAAAQNDLRTSNSTLNAFLGYPRKSWMHGTNVASNGPRPQASQPIALSVSQRTGAARAQTGQNGQNATSECSQPLPSPGGTHSSVSHSPTNSQLRTTSFSNSSPLVATTQAMQFPSSMQTAQATLPSPAPSTEHVSSPGNNVDQNLLNTDSASPRDNYNPNFRGGGGDPMAPPVGQSNNRRSSQQAMENPACETSEHRPKRPRLDTTNQPQPATCQNTSTNRRPSAPTNHQSSGSGNSATYSLPSLKYFVSRLTSYTKNLQNLPSGDVSQQRFQLLKEACEKDDCFYLALHQVYCLKTVNPAFQLAGLGPNQHNGLRLIEQMLVGNDKMSSHVVMWCAGFPMPLPYLLEHSLLYRSCMQMVISFLELVSQHWASFDAEVQHRGYPPLIDELVAVFVTPSPILHSVMFKTLLRRLSGWDENWARRYEYVFKLNQENYARRSKHQVSPAQTQAENETLVAAYRNLRLQHLQAMQAYSVPNVSGPVQQNQHGVPLAGSPQNPAAPMQFPGGYGYHTSNSAQSFSQQSPISQQSHSSPITPMVPTHHARDAMRPNRQMGSVPSQTRVMNNQQQQSLPFPSQLRSNSNNMPSHARAGPHQQASSIQQYLPKSSQRLLPPSGTVPVQLANPNPSLLALHQAHLKSPIRKFVSPGTDSENADYFQYLQTFATGPHPLGRTDPWYEWEFTVPAENMQTLPIDTTPPNQPVRTLADGNRMYRLRCVKTGDSSQFEERTWAISETAWPSVIYIHVNETELFVRRKLQHGKDLPLDISKYIKEGVNKVTFGFLRTPPEKERVFYALGVEVIEVGNLERVRGAIETLSQTRSLEQIKARLAPGDGDGDDEIAIVDDYIAIDLIDPFTAKIFEVPVRSKECQHRECFDLPTFLKTRQNKPPIHKNNRRTGHDEDWKCPICGCDARPQLLMIDEFLSGVRSELQTRGEDTTARAIRVKADGSWEPKVEKENGTANGAGSASENTGTDRRSESLHQNKQSTPTSSTTAPTHEVIEID